MSFDLTNKNIQDTFQNLLQRTGSDNRLFDLTGNEIGDLKISGSLTAQQYIVSSSVTNITTQQLSGSTIFGNSSDDTHTFTGDITASGVISASGGIFSGAHYFNVSQNDDFIFYHPPSDAIAIQSQDININGTNGVGIGYAVTQNNSAKLDVNGNINTNLHITASGNISASGDIFAHSGSFNYITASIIDVDADTIRFGGEPFTKANIQALKQGKSLKPLGVGKVNPDILAGDITASGDIKINGNILNTETFQMTSASSVVNTFETASIRSSKYMLQVTSASNYQVSEMLVLHNDGVTLNTEYAQLNSGLNLVDFSTKVNNSNVELIASSSFISCSIEFERTIIPI